MRFQFTQVPLKNVDIGSVVDGWQILRRTSNGNAIGFKFDTVYDNGVVIKQYKEVLLIHTEEFV